jgi:hypothetical protein
MKQAKEIIAAEVSSRDEHVATLRTPQHFQNAAQLPLFRFPTKGFSPYHQIRFVVVRLSSYHQVFHHRRNPQASRW